MDFGCSSFLPNSSLQLSQLEATLNLIEEAVVWTDADGNIQYGNSAWERLIQRPVIEVIQQPLVEVLPLQQDSQPVSVAEHPVTQYLQQSAQQTGQFKQTFRCELLQFNQLQTVEIVAASLPAPDQVDAAQVNTAQAGTIQPDTIPTTPVQPNRLFLIRVLSSSAIPSAASTSSAATPTAAVKFTESDYRLAFGASKIGVWSWDIQTGITTNSLEAITLNGFDLDDIQADYQIWRNAVHPKDIERVEQTLSEALNTKRSYETEYRVIHPDGSLRWILTRGQAIYSASGQPTHMIGIVMDISHLKKDGVVLRLAEEAWQENQQVLDAVMANLPGGVFRCLYRPDGTVAFTYASEAYHQLLELSPQEICSQPHTVFERLYPEERQIWQGIVEVAQTTLAPSYLEYRVVLPSGTERWLARTARFAWAANGDFVVDGIDIDITDRKRAEAQLQQQQQFLRAVIDNDPNLIFVKDWQGQYILANQAIANFYNLTVEELVQKNVRDIIANPEQAAEFNRQNQQVIRTQTPLFIPEEKVLDPLQNYKWLQWQKQPIYLPERQTYAVLGIGVDITERKRAEASLRSILQGTAAATGEEFFPVLVQNLALALDVRYAIVLQLTDNQLRPIAFWSEQSQPDLASDLAFDLDLFSSRHIVPDQPASNRPAPEIYCYPNQVRQQFPNSLFLQLLQAESYLGVTMRSGSGALIGNLCIIDSKPLKNTERAEAILRIFAARAVAELERQRATVELQQLNQELEARVEQRTQELIASLHEKEVLLQEVHHRVKNNLQIIQSLLNLQSYSTNEPQILQMLTDSQARIKAMALVHEKLYQSHNLAQINFAAYVHSLTRALLQSYVSTSKVQVSLQVADIELAVDTVLPCALIINELFSNAAKYAFTERQSGTITVEFGLDRSEPIERYRLAVADNGIGISPEVTVENPKSLGLRLVHALTRQLRGTLTVERHSGTRFTVTFAQTTFARSAPLGSTTPRSAPKTSN